MLTVNELKKDPEVSSIINVSEEQLEAIGYTEHSIRHLSIVSKWAGDLLRTLGASEEEIALGEIAGYLHDIGNSVNRADHAQSGALLAYDILIKRGLGFKESAEIMMAIGNHDEHCGTPVSKISAALIIADKSDVHKSRVRKSNVSILPINTNIHDRVNLAAEKSFITVEGEYIILHIKIDTAICSVMDYFEIYFGRMQLCRRAAEFFNKKFRLIINEVILL